MNINKTGGMWWMNDSVAAFGVESPRFEPRRGQKEIGETNKSGERNGVTKPPI